MRMTLNGYCIIKTMPALPKQLYGKLHSKILTKILKATRVGKIRNSLSQKSTLPLDFRFIIIKKMFILET